MSASLEAAGFEVSPALDDALYDQAMQFYRTLPVINASQWSSLLAYAERWQDVRQFVDRQSKRDWQNKADYKTFYLTLQKQLVALEDRARKLVPSGASPNAAREQLAVVAGPLTRAFLQHLCAEALLTARRERR